MPGKPGDKDKGSSKGQTGPAITKKAANPHGSPAATGSSPKHSKSTSRPGVDEKDASKVMSPPAKPTEPSSEKRSRRRGEGQERDKEEGKKDADRMREPGTRRGTNDSEPKREKPKKEDREKEGSKRGELEKERSGESSKKDERRKEGSTTDDQRKEDSKKDERKKEGSKKLDSKKEGSKKEGSTKDEHSKESSKRDEHKKEGSKKNEHGSERERRGHERSNREGSRSEEHKEGSKKDERKREDHKKDGQRKKTEEQRKEGSKSTDKLHSSSTISIRSDEPGAPIANAVMEREKKKQQAAAERSKKKDKDGDLSDQSQSHIQVYEDPPPSAATNKGSESPTVAKMVEVRDGENGDEYCYDDEKFEDYDEDFEEDEDEEKGEEEMEEEEEEEEEGGKRREQRDEEAVEEEQVEGEREDDEDEKRGGIEEGGEVEEVEEASGGEEERTVPAQPRALEQSTNRLNMAEIAMAISAENQAVETRQANLVSLGQEAEPKRDDLLESDSIPNLQPSPSRAHVQFSGASKREQQQRVSKRTSTRGQELLELIELDIVSFDLFELQPLSEYELYIKNFGMENTRQVIVQTGEDNMDRDIQTDAVTCSERWVQWPPEDFRGCGGPSDEESSEAARTINIGEGAVRLLSFLKKAGQVCSELLEENLIGCDESISSISHSQLPFCTDLICFPTLSSSFEGHFACDVKFSPIRDNLIAVAYSTPSITCVDSTVSGSSLLSRGVVCVWDTHHPSQPHQMLLCEATPTCCCFSPQKTYLVFAGNVDGSVVLWDLREPEFMHKSPLVGYPSLVPRVATFTTACLSTPDNHSSPICTIAPLTMGTRDPSHTASTSAIEDDSSGLSFQLATLDQSGRLNLWVVVEIYHPDPHGSESDLGLVPGGKVKLVKNVTIETCAPNGKTLSAAMAERVLCMQFSPLDANHLYVGMDTGSVHHFTRYGRRPIPKQYHSGQAEGLVYDITSISFCPQQPDHFLAAGSDGSIRLHCIAREYPLLYWPHSTGGNSVVSVQWSPSKPGLFVVLDENSIIYIWDLVQCDASPISSHQMKSSVITCQMPHCNETSRAPSLLLALADGSMELHYLKDSFCPKDSDMNQFNLYLDSLSSS